MDSSLQLNTIDLNTKVKCTEQQLAADLGGELAILNLKTGVYYGLDEIGTRIWTLLKENKTLLEIRDSILAEYSVTASQCETDLLRLVHELKQHELVEICQSPDLKS